jgi:NTE family protein
MDYSVKNFLIPGSVINIDTYIGQYYRVKALILKYIGRNQKYSLSADFHSDNTLIPNLHIKKETGNVVSRNFTAELSFARMLGLNHLINISGEIENLNLLPRYVSASGLDWISYDNFKTSFFYRINSLDNKHFPDMGTILNISGSSTRLLSGIIKTDLTRTVYDSKNKGDFLFDRYFILNGNFRQYIPSGEKVTISLHADALFVSKSDSAISGNNFFLIGGIQSLNERSVPMIGYHPLEVPVKKAVGAGIELDYEIFKDLHVSLMSDLFAVQDIYMQEGFSFLSGFGAGAGYMSVIGPIRVGIMYGKNPDNEYFNNFKGYISIGYNF